MKKVFIISMILCGFSPAYSQDLIKEIQKMTLANDSLHKQVIKPLKDSILNLNIAIQKQSSMNTVELSMLKEQVNTLEKDKIDLNKKVNDLEKNITNLNKNKVKIEKDSLQKQVERLTANIAALNQKNQEKERQLAEEKQIGEQKAKAEIEKGRSEVLATVINSYTNKSFDELIITSTKLSVQRDMQLVGNHAEVKPILSDLGKYFSAEELLSKKIDVAQIKNAQIQLNQIKQQSTLLDKLKEDIEYYKDFNDELKKTIEKLVDLDQRKVAAGVTEAQNLKFKEILEATNYLYNYYSYSHYPYLSDIVLEIIKRKHPDADKDITDLLKKLQ